MFAALANGRLRRLAVRWKLEDACWRRSHAHCRRWCRGHAPSTQTEPQLEPATSAGVILPETGQFVCYARYSCDNNCNVVVKLVQECKFFMHFTFVLRKQFAMNDTFLREANSYKRALALRNSRQVYLERWPLKQCALMSSPNLVTASGKISRKRQKTAC